MKHTWHAGQTIGGWLLVAVAAGVILAAGCTPASPQAAVTPVPTFTPTSAVPVVSFATAQPTPTLRVATATPPLAADTAAAPISPLMGTATDPALTPLAGMTTDQTTPPGGAIISSAVTSTVLTAQPSPTVVIPNRPAGENPLTGLTVSDPAVLQRRPIHVRVGNDVGARPQAGLSAADLVYEEIVEWWVTRYTAVYLSQTPEVVAPIRSARLINTQLTVQYNAALSNSGGSDGVRWELSQEPIVNLDEYFWPQPYFYRENEGWQTRLALNVRKARELMANKNLETIVVLRGFTFSDTPPGGQPALTIHVAYPKRTSTVDWRYDLATGRYLRWVLGQPMTDATTKEQLSAANVILYYAEHQATEIVEDSNGATSIRILVDGEGRAQVFRDGVVLEGRWRTDGSQTPEFVFPDGQPIPLKRGNSWIEVVPLDTPALVNGTATP
jgi:hypothetical protein